MTTTGAPIDCEKQMTQLSTDLIPLRMFDLLKKGLGTTARERQKIVFFRFVEAAKEPFGFACEYRLNVDDLMDQAVNLINREADFVTNPGELEWRELEKDWYALVNQIIEHMKEVNPTRNYDEERRQLVCFCIMNTNQRPLWTHV